MVTLSAPEGDGVTVLVAMVFVGILLLLTRVHLSYPRSWSLLFGANAAALCWLAVLGNERFKDFMELNGWITGLGSLAALILAPVLVTLAWLRPVEDRLRWFLFVLTVSILALTWMDATVGVMLLPGPDDAWWYGHVIVAVFFSCVLFGVAPPPRLRRRQLAVGLAAVWIWAGMLPFVPWNQDKRMAIAILGIEGETIDVVQKRMANFMVTVEGDRGEVPLYELVELGSRRELAYGAVRDLDLSSFDADSLSCAPGLGTCGMELRDGVVIDVGCSYD